MDDQRASDADRERAAEHLRRAGGDGRLTVDELGDRVQLAYQAQTRGELERLVHDVEQSAPLARRAGSGLVVRPGEGGARWVVAIMSGAKRTGRWRVSPQCTVFNVMGGAELDLNDAELAADDVQITILSLMGGSDIYVPEDLRVEISDVGIMGGNEIERGRPEAERPDGPVVRLRLISIMGGANVRRGPKLNWRERREKRRLERRA
ncbi:MAG: DUF1707 domain-containing protein [Actinomycetota bacterium]|nr:DUF1707 domain-containing protein [Actinomycetota bacterium]